MVLLRYLLSTSSVDTVTSAYPCTYLFQDVVFEARAAREDEHMRPTSCIMPLDYATIPPFRHKLKERPPDYACHQEL
jgi:hypothetical protein